MKKTVLVLLGVLTLSLCACGSEEKTSGRGSYSEVKEEKEEKKEEKDEKEDKEEKEEKEEVKEEVKEEKEEAKEDKEEVKEEAKEEKDDDIWLGSDLLTMGEVNGDCYESETLGLGCELVGWTYADSAAIAETNSWVESNMGVDIQEMISESGTMMDMSATAPSGLENINIQYQDIEAVYGVNVDAKELVSLMAMMMGSQLEMYGYEDVEVEESSVEMDGMELPSLEIRGKLNGADIYQEEILVDCGDYLGMITLTSFGEDKLDELWDCFYSLY